MKLHKEFADYISKVQNSGDLTFWYKNGTLEHAPHKRREKGFTGNGFQGSSNSRVLLELDSRVLLGSDSRVLVFGTLQGRSFALCISKVEVPFNLHKQDHWGLSTKQSWDQVLELLAGVKGITFTLMHTLRFPKWTGWILNERDKQHPPPSFNCTSISILLKHLWVFAHLNFWKGLSPANYQMTESVMDLWEKEFHLQLWKIQLVPSHPHTW